MVITSNPNSTTQKLPDNGIESGPLRLASEVAQNSVLKNAILDPSVKASSELNAMQKRSRKKIP